MGAIPPPVSAALRVGRVFDRLAADEYLVEVGADRAALHLTSAAGVQLSREARLAFSLGPSAQDEGTPMALEPLVAVVDVPEGAETLARELAGRVGRSGLFYESHLADWAEGTRTREEVEREPQARIGLSSEPVKEGEAWTLPAPLEPIVREQLAALERQEVRFALPYGEARPAELVVAQEHAGREADGEAAGAWISRLKLDLPTLGEITARIRLSGDALSISLEASDPETAACLDAAREPLCLRLAARELHVARVEVERHA